MFISGCGVAMDCFVVPAFIVIAILGRTVSFHLTYVSLKSITMSMGRKYATSLLECRRYWQIIG